MHPGDTLARAIGLAHGKCEAWYVLSATADASIAVGLKQRLTPAQLRASIHDGSIAERVQWRLVRPGDSTFVPAGTIHAIGAGLVIVEIQQRSDTTFRLFDYGRNRELHVDIALAAASADQRDRHAPPRKLTSARTLLVGGPRFVLERLALPPGGVRDLNATVETWLFTLAGGGRVGSIDVAVGIAVFLEADRARIEAASDGLEGLVAYVGSNPAPELLCRHNGTSVRDPAPARNRRICGRKLSPSFEPLRQGGAMSPLGRFAFIGNSLPRRCGIATFTTDLQQAIERSPPHEPCGIVAMTDHGRTYDYPPAVRLQIDDRRLGDYERAADVLNAARYEVVSLQHEFGIFGGEAGGHIMALVARLAMPIVTTLHTVLSQPTPAQRRVLGGIIAASSPRHRHGRKRQGTAAHRLSGGGREDRGHSARNSRLSRSSSPTRRRAPSASPGDPSS